MAKKFIKKEITPEVVSTFIEGHDPQERIVNFEYNYRDDFIKVYYRDENDDKRVVNEPFYPFLWATKRACMRMCNQDRNELIQLMNKYHVTVKALDVTNINDEVVEEILEGYTYMFKATRPMSYGKFLEFFKAAGNSVYSKKKEENPDIKSSFTEVPEAKKDKKQYLVVTPIEQFMISTGKRMFKGYDDYDQTLRLIFDLETTGLDTKNDRIEQFGIRFNRPVKLNGEYINFERIFSTVGETEEEKNASELENIINFLKVIYTFRPDIITAHNGEIFDWNMIFGACERLGTTIEELSKAFFKGEPIYKNKRETILKLGGEIETFNQTIVPGTTVTDSLHAVRRAQALDSNMLFSNLKYITKYADKVKPNRVYVPGDRISEIWNDNTQRYAFNNEDGDWYIYDVNHVIPEIKPDPNKNIEYFNKLIDEDMILRSVSGDTACKYPEGITANELYETYLEDIKYQNINNVTKKGKTEDKFTLYRKNVILNGYELVTGKYIVERYLLDDLWECDKVEHHYNTSNFLICKMLPVPFQKCCTMGTAGQWKFLMLAWSYENNLAIPPFGENRPFTGGLSRLIKVGFVDNVAKLDYNSLYPSIILTWGISNPKDLMNTMLAFLEHVLTQREKYKNLTKEAGKKADTIKEKLSNREYNTPEEGRQLNEEMQYWKSEKSFNGNKQLPLKIFGNSYFGSLSAENVFPWGSLDSGERTTCTGRMCLRLMIYRFSNISKINKLDDNSYNYIPIVGDTDGFNFKLPQKFRYTKENPYVSTGLSRVTKKDKTYTGPEADVAEFNDLFMRGKMGLDLEEVISSTINFSRKNYADHFPEELPPKDVKKIGNSIKSKKMSTYIANFLDKGIRLLLQKRGKDFIEEYYSYIDKIYNYQIPLKDIASKGKVKKSIKEYIKDCQTVTKSGNPKARQAWMELALKNNMEVHMGETIYYINTGKQKSHADVKRATHFYGIDGLFNEKKEMKVSLEKEYKKDNIDGKLAPKDKQLNLKEWVKKHHPEITIEEEISLNCEIVPTNVIESEFDIFCEEGKEYNVPKYISAFNSRITPLLVCFHPDIRNKILVTNPDDRQYFTEEECELCNGLPNNPGDQDTYEQLMTMEDKEIRFWEKHPEWEIPFLKECEMDWGEILSDYHQRLENEKNLGITKIREKFDEVLENLSSTDIEKFEDGELPSGLSSIISIDPQTGNFVAKDYPDIVIGTIYDVFDAIENRSSYMEGYYE